MIDILLFALYTVLTVIAVAFLFTYADEHDEIVKSDKRRTLSESDFVPFFKMKVSKREAKALMMLVVWLFSSMMWFTLAFVKFVQIIKGAWF